MKGLVHTHPVWNNRIFFLFVLAALVVQPAFPFQARSVDVIATAGSRVETVPGKLLTLSFKVTNNTTVKKRYESTATLPAGWRRLAKEFPFEIEGGAGDIRLVSVSIPAETPAGEYLLRYGVRDQANPSDAAEASITVVITAVKEQGLKLVDSPRLVLAGDSYVSVFLLNNKGNVSGVVRLTAASSNRFKTVLDSTVVYLQPGEARSISVRVETDRAMTSKAQDVLDVTAERDGQNPVRASSYVEVVPRVTGVEDRFVEFPIQVKGRFAGEQGKNGAQVEIVGSGPLGEGRNDRLDVLLRTPDIQQKSILGQRDEYRLNYTTNHYDLYLGDKNFSLSPLTEFNRYAFGASGNVTLEDVAVGAFYNETRFFSPALKEIAGFVNVHLRDDAQIGVNYLGKRGQSASDIFTLRGLVQPYKGSEVDLEYGAGYTGGQRDPAYAARWSGRAQWLSYDARYVWAGPKYPGYYRDLDFRNLSLNLAPVKNIILEAYYRDEKRNLDRDTSLSLAPRDRYYLVGIGYAGILSVYYRENDQDDLLPQPHYQRAEQTWQMRAGHSFSGITLIANGDIGTLQDRLAVTKSPFQRYSVFASVQATERQTYSVSAEYSKDQDPTTLQDQERLAGSVSIGVLLSEMTRFSAALYGNRTRGGLEQTYTLFDVSFEHTFPFGHTIALRGRQSIFTPSDEGKELAYLVEYSLPVGVPIARKTGNGHVSGRVVDSEKGLGVPNVLVYVGGATAVTDRNGDFQFPSLTPDKYFVQLDMASVGLNRIALQQLPYEIAIVGGQESRFDISLTRSITVSGTVILFGAKEQSLADTSQPAIAELGGQPNAVMELSNGIEVHRRVTDNRGRFAFAGIRPGHWTLRIVDGNLPVNTYFEKQSYEIQAAPGESKEATFKAIPRKRRIQILQQGKTIEAAPQKEKPVEPVPKKETKAPALGPQQPTAAAALVQWTIVFFLERKVFAIEHSTWPTKRMADSVETILEQQIKLPAFVETVHTEQGKTMYRILLGVFHSRKQAEDACAKLNKTP